MLRRGEIDGVTFTSASTVHGFVRALEKTEVDSSAREAFDPEQIRALCIGRQTAQAAEGYGMRTVTAREASIDALVEMIVEIYSKNI